jgi:Tfp pilus assembly protein PilF
VLLTLLAYEPVWHAGFIWDDDIYVTGNPLLTAPDGWRRIWFSLDSPSQYFPLIYSVFRLAHGLWGWAAAGYHGMNLWLHVVNALLVWRVLERLKVRGAWLAAVIFALHPVQVETVAWITELKNVLMLFFYLLTVLAWLNYQEQPAGRRGKYYALAFVFFGLALSAKTTACTLPVVLLLLAWWQGRPVTGRRLAEVSPLLALGVGMGLVTVWWERYHQGTQGALFALGLPERLLVAGRAVWFYAGKLVWPADLTFSYPRWTVATADLLDYGWLLAALAAAALLWWRRRRTGRGPETALWFFVLTLGPVLGFIMLYTFRYTYVADHYQYVACLGPIALFSTGLVRLGERWRPGQPGLERWLGLGLGCGLAVLTWRQARMYENSQTLWQATLDRNPGSWLAHNNLGVTFHDEGRPEAAEAQYRAAIRLSPDYPEAHYNLGNVLLLEGRTDDAIEELQTANRLDPKDAGTLASLGLAELTAGRKDEAAGAFQAAIDRQPDYPGVRNNLGQVLLEEGRTEAAAAQFEAVLKSKPEDAAGYYNLGLVRLKEGRYDEAIDWFQEAIRRQPDYAEACNNLGIALFQRGRVAEAVEKFEAAVRLQPDYAEAQNNLARARTLTGKPAEPRVSR